MYVCHWASNLREDSTVFTLKANIIRKVFVLQAKAEAIPYQHFPESPKTFHVS